MKKTLLTAMLVGGMLAACTDKKQITDNDMAKIELTQE